MSDDDLYSKRKGRLIRVGSHLGTMVQLVNNLWQIILGVALVIVVLCYQRYDLINPYIRFLLFGDTSILHQSAVESSSQREHAYQSAQSLAFRPVYLDLGLDSAGYSENLKRQLGTGNVEVTDDQTRSGITLQVTGNVLVKAGIKLGDSQTWRADATLGLEAFGTQDHSRLFGRSYHGQEIATLPDAARERAVNDAVHQLVADYQAHVKEGKN